MENSVLSAMKLFGTFKDAVETELLVDHFVVGMAS